MDVEQRLRQNIEQREMLSFLAEFSDRLSPLVTFDELIEVVHRLPVPFVADSALVHIAAADGTVRLAAADASTLHEPALAGMASSVDSAGGTATTTERLGTSPSHVPLDVDGKRQSGPVAGLRQRTAGVGVRSARRRRAGATDPSGARSHSAVPRGARGQSPQGRIPRHAVARAANAAQCHLRLGRILRARHLDPGTAHAVEVIERNAETQIRLIEEVLDVSRIITGKMTLAEEAIDIRVVVRAAIDTVRPGMHAKRIRLEERIDEVPPVIGDRHRLQQVFWNLLSNALKFTGEDGTITVSLRDAPPHVEFEIADTGVGIRREVLPFVFDRFRQADSSTTRTHGGLGLGLAIVRHIVELHGGTVRAVSEGEGYGATFVIRLPSAAAARCRTSLGTSTSSPSTTAPALQDERFSWSRITTMRVT